MNKSVLVKLLRYNALALDALYVLWLLYNGIDEGFKNILSVQGVASLGMIVLLILNIFLLTNKTDR